MALFLSTAPFPRSGAVVLCLPGLSQLERRFPEYWNGIRPGRGDRLRKASFSVPTVGHNLTMLPGVIKQDKTKGTPLENHFGGN